MVASQAEGVILRYWIAVAGTRERPLDNRWWDPQAAWEGNQGDVQVFSARPHIEVGDRLVMYASGSPGRFGAGRFFAVREVVSAPGLSGRERWPWKVAVREIIAGPELELCPTLDEIGVRATSLRGHSHIELNDSDAGRLAEELLQRASRPRGG